MLAEFVPSGSCEGRICSSAPHPFLACRWLSSPCVSSRHLHYAYLYKFLSFNKDSNHIWQVSTLLQLWLHLNYTCNSCISKWGHILKYWELRLQHINFGRGHNSTHNRGHPCSMGSIIISLPFHYGVWACAPSSERPVASANNPKQKLGDSKPIARKGIGTLKRKMGRYLRKTYRWNIW